MSKPDHSDRYRPKFAVNEPESHRLSGQSDAILSSGARKWEATKRLPGRRNKASSTTITSIQLSGMIVVELACQPEHPPSAGFLKQVYEVEPGHRHPSGSSIVSAAHLRGHLTTILAQPALPACGSLPSRRFVLTSRSGSPRPTRFNRSIVRHQWAYALSSSSSLMIM